MASGRVPNTSITFFILSVYYVVIILYSFSPCRARAACGGLSDSAGSATGVLGCHLIIFAEGSVAGSSRHCAWSGTLSPYRARARPVGLRGFCSPPARRLPPFIAVSSTLPLPAIALSLVALPIGHRPEQTDSFSRWMLTSAGRLPSASYVQFKVEEHIYTIVIFLVYFLLLVGYPAVEVAILAVGKVVEMHELRDERLEAAGAAAQRGLASMVVTEAQVVGLIGDIGVGLAVASHLVIPHQGVDEARSGTEPVNAVLSTQLLPELCMAMMTFTCPSSKLAFPNRSEVPYYQMSHITTRSTLLILLQFVSCLTFYSLSCIEVREYFSSGEGLFYPSVIASFGFFRIQQ